MTRLCSLCVVLLAALAFTGCQTAQTNADLQYNRMAISRDLQSYGQTDYQDNNDITRTIVQNLRGLNNDIVRFLLLDHPNRSGYEYHVQ